MYLFNFFFFLRDHPTTLFGGNFAHASILKTATDATNYSFKLNSQRLLGCHLRFVIVLQYNYPIRPIVP